MTSDARPASVRTALVNGALVVVGLFGLVLGGLTVLAFADGTATQATPVAGLFGLATAIFVAWELARR